MICLYICIYIYISTHILNAYVTIGATLGCLQPQIVELESGERSGYVTSSPRGGLCDSYPCTTNAEGKPPISARAPSI